MISEVKYQGVSNSPSDYQCQDGELSLSLNAIHEDGSLKPIPQPKEIFTLSPGDEVLHIHKTSEYENFIVKSSGNRLKYCTISGSYEIISAPIDGTIHSVSSLGNTLIVLTSNGLIYYLFKERRYKELGSHLPELPLSFGITGKVELSDPVFSKGDAPGDDLDNAIMGATWKFIKEKATEKGLFIFPFFVRYAYRLFDGSLTMHSAPILMLPTSHESMTLVMMDEEHGDFRIASPIHALDMAVLSRQDIENIKRWDDVITSVDIFISAPIYTIDSEGKPSKYKNNFARSQWKGAFPDFYSVSGMLTKAADNSHNAEPGSGAEGDSFAYAKRSFENMLTYRFSKAPAEFVEIPHKSIEDIDKEITSCHAFYLVKSYKLSELTTQRKKIPLSKGVLESLQAREHMKDDYDSHDSIIPRYSYIYNKRINFANLRKRWFGGFSPASALCHTDGKKEANTKTMAQSGAIYKTFIKNRAGEEVVVSSAVGQVGQEATPQFYYHPNPDAYITRFYPDALDGSRYIEMPLTRHPTLNGAYFWGGWEYDKRPQYGSMIPDTPADSLIEKMPNKIYTSEVGNPFHFPITGINTVGTGEIMGMAAATKAMSEGQFGQFPLYAFTRDGVMALEVSSVGLYSKISPVSRDVCVNEGSISQTDNAVVFASERGVMVLSGSESVCISDMLLGTSADIKRLPRFEEILQSKGIDNPGQSNFLDFISRCGIVYEYRQQRIIVFNRSSAYAYVFSLRSKKWGMMKSTITSSVNSYPYAFVMTQEYENYKLADLSSDEQMTDVRGAILTRPIKLGNPDVLKTIGDSIQRGVFSPNSVSVVLYGSRDLSEWGVVSSSNNKYLRGHRGSGYKYFRYGVFFSLTKQDSISGCSIDLRVREHNKLR